MPRLIKNGEIIFDGIHTKAELQKEANKKLELVEIAAIGLGIDDIVEFLFMLDPDVLFKHIPYNKARVIDDFRRRFSNESENGN